MKHMPKYINILDLRFNGNLNPDLRGLFNEIANKMHGKFNDLVSEISEPYKYNLDWWVEGPASRNTQASPFFYYYCSFHLVDELIKRNYKIYGILVDSEAFRKILKSYLFKKDSSITIKNEKNALGVLFEQVIKPVMKMFLELCRRLYQYMCAYTTKYLEKALPDRPLILIDIFIIPDFVSKDRYYNGLWENLSDRQKKIVFFVPTIVMTPLRKMVSVYTELRKTERNFLIKEDYLQIKDLLFAVGHYFRILNIKIKPCLVIGEDLSLLVQEELRRMKDFRSAIEGILNCRFAQRVKEKNVNLSLVVNWFENYVVDKGWNSGFGKYYPDVKTIGYRGLVPARLSLSQMYPTEQELLGKVLPSRIAVIGKGFVESTKKYARNLCVETAPAFRFQHIWKKEKITPHSEYYTVLIGLSIMLLESVQIVRMLAACLPTIMNPKLRFWVKPHPTMSQDALKGSYGGKWPKELEMVTGTTNNLIRESDILISGMSSICLEAMTLAIPVIVVKVLAGLNYNPIPEEVPQELWRPCCTSEEIMKALEYYRNRPQEEIRRHEKMGNKIREEYFEPVTREGVTKFLNLDENTEKEYA
jgi:hypothetical protein